MKAIRNCILILFVSILVNPVYSQTVDAFTGSLLWKVSGKDLKEPSYILGTHHWTETDFVDSIPGIHIAMQETGQVVGELLLEDMSKLQAAIMRESLLPDSLSYEHLLTPEDYAKLGERLSEIFGKAKGRMMKLKPWLISITYYGMIYTEMYTDINFRTLVSIDEQMQKQAIFNPDDLCTPTRANMDAMNKDRNNKWLEKLPQIMADKPTFVVVGALHLAGEVGLLYQLNRMGYKVEAVE